MADRVDLYKAVKHQVETGYEDHGYNLAELWAKVNEVSTAGTFWRRTCLRDYRDYLKQVTDLAEEVDKFRCYFRGRTYENAADLRFTLSTKLGYDMSYVESANVVHAIDWENHIKIVIERVTPYRVGVVRILPIS